MRRWALGAVLESVAVWVFLFVVAAKIEAQKGNVLVFSGSTNANYEPLIIPSAREPVFVPSQAPEAAGIANPSSGVVTGADETLILTTPADTTYGAVTSAPPNLPILVTNAPANSENQEVLDNSPYPLAPPPFVSLPPPFGGTPVGSVQTPASPAPSTTTPFNFSPGVATPPPPMPGLPPALPGGPPGLSSGAGIAGPPPGPPPPFTRAPGSRF